MEAREFRSFLLPGQLQGFRVPVVGAEARLGQDVAFWTVGTFIHDADIVDVRAEGQGEVGGEGPGSGSPGDEVGGTVRQILEAGNALRHLEPYGDCRIVHVLVTAEGQFVG